MRFKAVRCFICGVKLRFPLFPLNLALWREKAHFYEFDIQKDGEEYSVSTVLCEKDLHEAKRCPAVADALILGRIEAKKKSGDIVEVTEEDED